MVSRSTENVRRDYWSRGIAVRRPCTTFARRKWLKRLRGRAWCVWTAGGRRRNVSKNVTTERINKRRRRRPLDRSKAKWKYTGTRQECRGHWIITKGRETRRYPWRRWSLMDRLAVEEETLYTRPKVETIQFRREKEIHESGFVKRFRDKFRTVLR